MHSGIYALIIRMDKKRAIKIGALGTITFEAGYYLYIGSAQKNMDARINRHKRQNKKLRWHIDYLLTHGTVEAHLEFPLEKRCEEKIAIEMAKKFEFVRGFGSSDTRAPSHLFKGKRDVLRDEVINLARRCLND